MEKAKKIIPAIIYGIAGFYLLQSVYDSILTLIKSGIHKRWYSGIPIAMFIVILILLSTVLVLTIISFFKENRGLKIALFVGQCVLILTIVVPLLVDYFIYFTFLKIVLWTALIFLIDLFIRKVWKHRRVESDSNTESIDNSRKIVFGVIYGFSIFNLLRICFERIMDFIMYRRYSNFFNKDITSGGYFTAVIIMMIAFFAVIVLATISFFLKNRGVKIAAIISQGALFLITIILNSVNEQLFFLYWDIAFCSLLIFLMNLFVYKIWKHKQDEPESDELKQHETQAEYKYD